MENKAEKRKKNTNFQQNWRELGSLTCDSTTIKCFTGINQLTLKGNSEIY